MRLEDTEDLAFDHYWNEKKEELYQVIRKYVTIDEVHTFELMACMAYIWGDPKIDAFFQRNNLDLSHAYVGIDDEHESLKCFREEIANAQESAYCD